MVVSPPLHGQETFMDLPWMGISSAHHRYLLKHQIRPVVSDVRKASSPTCARNLITIACCRGSLGTMWAKLTDARLEQLSSYHYSLAAKGQFRAIMWAEHFTVAIWIHQTRANCGYMSCPQKHRLHAWFIKRMSNRAHSLCILPVLVFWLKG